MSYESENMKLSELKVPEEVCRTSSEHTAARAQVAAGEDLVVLVDLTGKVLTALEYVQAAQDAGREWITVIKIPIPSRRLITALQIIEPERALRGERWTSKMVLFLTKHVEKHKMGFFFDEIILTIYSKALRAFNAPPEEFKSYDLDLSTDYCCPMCHYEWSGRPK